MEIDVRDIDEERRDSVLHAIIGHAETISKRRGVEMSHRIINQDPPAPCASHVVDAAQEAADELGLASMKMVSRAYHDALFMAQIAPTGEFSFHVCSLARSAPPSFLVQVVGSNPHLLTLLSSLFPRTPELLLPADVCAHVACLCIWIARWLSHEKTVLGMIFIPCRDGVSHRPDEYSSPEDMAKGIKALALTMAKLAAGPAAAAGDETCDDKEL